MIAKHLLIYFFFGISGGMGTLSISIFMKLSVTMCLI